MSDEMVMDSRFFWDEINIMERRGSLGGYVMMKMAILKLSSLHNFVHTYLSVKKYSNDSKITC